MLELNFLQEKKKKKAYKMRGENLKTKKITLVRNQSDGSLGFNGDGFFMGILECWAKFKVLAAENGGETCLKFVEQTRQQLDILKIWLYLNMVSTNV